MVVGLGIDLVDVQRIRRSLERFGEHFCTKLLHDEEMASIPTMPNQDTEGTWTSAPSPRLVEWVAGRFAAKEAAFKALGTGLANGIQLHDVRIIPNAAGKPEISLHGKAETLAKSLGAVKTHVTMTHTATTAAAVVILDR